MITSGDSYNIWLPTCLKDLSLHYMNQLCFFVVS